MQKKKRHLFTMLVSVSLMISFGSQAVEPDAADWFLSVNVSSIKNSPLADFIEDEHGEKDGALEMISHVFGDEIPDQINEINIYGSIQGKEDFSVLVQGDFTTASKDVFFAHENLQIDTRELSFGNHTIQEWTFNESTSIVGFEDEDITDSDTNAIVYVTEVRPDVIMLSRDLKDVQNWLSGQNDFSELSQNGIFSVIVNVKEALASGGIKVGGHHNAFQSDLMKKISQISFSMIEDGENMLLEAALSANDKETAAQIQQVMNGLVALNALSNKNLQNDLGAQVLNNLKIESNGSNIIVSSYAPFALIQKHKEDGMYVIDLED
ncbi:hypothetical protein [Marinicella sp. W31]|uniref:hypothetical protein n=1 Tax=Marinicella sp. W31 TaxID=3023713 RepID=UPI003756AB89